jgi:hypothetical protein
VLVSLRLHRSFALQWKRFRAAVVETTEKPVLIFCFDFYVYFNIFNFNFMVKRYYQGGSGLRLVEKELIRRDVEINNSLARFQPLSKNDRPYNEVLR